MFIKISAENNLLKTIKFDILLQNELLIIIKNSIIK